MCRLCRHYLYRAGGTPKLFIIHYSLAKYNFALPVAFIYTFLLKLQIVLLLSVIVGDLYCKLDFYSNNSYNLSEVTML